MRCVGGEWGCEVLMGGKGEGWWGRISGENRSGIFRAHSLIFFSSRNKSLEWWRILRNFLSETFDYFILLSARYNHT